MTLNEINKSLGNKKKAVRKIRYLKDINKGGDKKKKKSNIVIKMKLTKTGLLIKTSQRKRK